ncbi:MAG: STAS domain-containing protein, partial [Bacilli bacterium]|nr:STAS domain-containing protein [Bacilli bacterium]
MYKLESNLTNEILTITFFGAIDSSNAEEVDRLLREQIKENKNVTFDFENVNYISSAGLRIILKFAKGLENFEVINVSNDVYDIFDMTGFTQIIKVKKALRVISIEGKELIGEGYMGRVYRLNDETIIKVFYRNSTIDDIKREISLAKKAFILGIPTAIPFDLVKVKEGGYGSVFELLKSSCFNKLFQNHPENEDQYVKMYINLLKEMMKIKVNDADKGLIPSKRDEAVQFVKGLRGEDIFNEDVLDK